MDPSSSNSTSPAEVTPRRRAVVACTFCRHRKIKCNNERPVCANCKTYAKDCVYEPTHASSQSTTHTRPQRRAAPSRNSQRAGPPAGSASSRDHGDDQVRELGSEPEGIATASNPADPGVARILVSANGISSYHGRTSALFEENVHEKASAAEHRPRMPDEWVERGLVAEAARQRQMEELNFRQGKLDFDGVSPDLGMHLLSLHWNRQHHSFLITYRPAFMRDMACDGPYFSKLLLNAIYFGAAKFSPRLEVRRDPGDVRTAGWRYRQRVRELLGESLDRSEVTTIQALLVMTNSLFALGDERSAAWLYAGLALRMMFDLGMHVDLTGTARFSDEDLEIRRRVFWSAFVVDKVQSLYQGRPASLKEPDALVPIKFLDTYEELENWQPFAYSQQMSDYPGSPAYSTSTFTALCSLSLTMNDILSCIYTEKSSDQSGAQLSEMLERLQTRLDDWKASLPAHLQITTSQPAHATIPPPHVFSLQAMYNVLIILLHRPFVADGHLYNTSRSISVDSLLKCATAASSIVHLLRAYHHAFSVRRAPYLISYATYVAATIHARVAARHGSGSTAHRCLETCLAVFQENQETNTAVQKANVIIESLIKRLGIVIGPITDAVLESDGRVDSREDQRSSSFGSSSHLLAQELPSQRRRSGRDRSNVIRPSNLAAAATRNQGERSPGSEWVDIDGIIQSFLRNRDGPANRPIVDDADENLSQVALPVFPESNATSQLISGQAYSMGIQGITPNEMAAGLTYPGTIHWNNASNAPIDTDMTNSLEDPLFGFNGASLDSFPFMGWSH